MKLLNAESRFIQAAIQIADENGRFDAGRVREELKLFDASLRKIATSLQKKGMLTASYGDNWQLTGDAREWAEQHAASKKKADATEAIRKSKPRKLIPRKRLKGKGA